MLERDGEEEEEEEDGVMWEEKEINIALKMKTTTPTTRTE